MSKIDMVDVLEDWTSPIMDDIYDYVRLRLNAVDDGMAGEDDVKQHLRSYRRKKTKGGDTSVSASASASGASSKTQSDTTIKIDPRIHKNLNVWITQAFNYIRHSEAIIDSAKPSDIRSELYPIGKIDSSLHMDLLYSHYVPSLVRTYIEERGKYVMRTEFIISGYRFIVDFMFFSEATAGEIEEYKTELHWILTLLGVIVMVDLRKRRAMTENGKTNATRHKVEKSTKRADKDGHDEESANKTPKNFHIQLMLTPFIKTLPKSSMEILGPLHVNSGVSLTRGGSWSFIMIFRREEWFKVLVHEMLHALRWELSGIDQTFFRDNMASVFPIKSEFSASESIAEFWATLLNAVFIGYRQTKPGVAVKGSTDGVVLKEGAGPSRHYKTDHPFVHLEHTLATARFLVMAEQVFSMFQLAKVLRFMNMKYTDLYLPGDAPTTLRTYMYREDTNVFSYYVLKALLLYHVDEYIGWSRANSYNRTFMMSLKPTRDTLRSLFLWILTKYKSTAFLTEVERMRESYLSLVTMSDDDIRRLATTTRMTISKWKAE
jgi:hypothetical protein